MKRLRGRLAARRLCDRCLAAVSLHEHAEAPTGDRADRDRGRWHRPGIPTGWRPSGAALVSIVEAPFRLPVSTGWTDRDLRGAALG